MCKVQVYFFRLFVLFITLMSCQQAKAATFHSILIGDTDDEILKKVAKKDMLNMSNHMQNICNALDTVEKFQQSTYVGRRVDVTILEDLKNLEIGTDDIVFLYYSGHGFNTKQNQSQIWPYIYFNHGDIGINSPDIVEILMQHQPRLVICFIDCCNNILKPKDFPNFFEKEANIDGLTFAKSNKVKNLRKLFQETHGLILIAGAAPGYYSEGTDRKGSCFTNVYLRIFNDLVKSSENASWEEILSQAQQHLWKRQHPYYELHIN